MSTCRTEQARAPYRRCPAGAFLVLSRVDLMRCFPGETGLQGQFGQAPLLGGPVGAIQQLGQGQFPSPVYLRQLDRRISRAGKFDDGMVEVETYLGIDAKPLDVYTGTITLYVVFDVLPDAKTGPVKIAGNVHYQACDEKQCFFPTSTPFSIETEIVPAGQAVKTQNVELFGGYDPKALTA